MTAVEEFADVLVVGAGPAGLTAATHLRGSGIERVVVLDREVTAGGIPRHSDHPGYGVRDQKRMRSGPQYARRLVEQALDNGVEIRTSTMATDWVGERALAVTSPAGRGAIDAGVVVLATGARERPRTARLVPGDRPSGVLTTGQLQNLVHLHGARSGGLIGNRAVVVGAQLVSWSAVMTLREAGCRTVLMTSEYDRLEVPPTVALAGRTLLNVPTARCTKVARIVGHERVEAVELLHLETGRRRLFACDTVVFTGDWIPDNELARARGLRIDHGHLGPIVDTALRTSAPGIFAAGNLLHPVATADVAALDGRHVATAVCDYLGGHAPIAPPVTLVAGAGLAWVAPGVMHRDGPAPARDRLLAWPTMHAVRPRVEAWQGGQLLARRRLPLPASPGQVVHLPWAVVAHALPGAGDVTVNLT